MNLPKNVEYSDLDGEETKQILAARFWQFMETIPEFQRRFALTRVQLRLELVVDIWGASPPRKVLHDSLVMTATEAPPSTFTDVEAHHQATSEVDAFNNPPDLVREEHGLPVHRGQRNPQTGFMENVPVILDGMAEGVKFKPAPKPDELPPPPKASAATEPSNLPANQPSPTATNKIWGYEQRDPYAAVVYLDKGSMSRGRRDEAPTVGGDKFASTIMSASRGGVVMPQPDFLGADHRTNSRVSVEHVQGRIEESGRILSEAERQFNSAKDTSNVEWSNPEDKQ